MRKKPASRWNSLCAEVEQDDGFPTRGSGPWARDKLWFWNRYIEITTRAMVGHPRWPEGVVYVDLFAGPGICTIRESGERIPGSPLIAAGAPKPFRKILLCELDDGLAVACETRLRQRIPEEQFRVYHGDCNQTIDEVVGEIPRGCLTVAFLDPPGLDIAFETIETLSQHGRVDLLILFPDAMDILRNYRHYYFDQTDSKLDRFLGPDSQWREQKAHIQSATPSNLRRLFVNIYKDQLRRRLRYQHLADEVIRGPHGPLYRLVYATKHEVGMRFWNESIAREFGGQRRLFS